MDDEAYQAPQVPEGTNNLFGVHPMAWALELPQLRLGRIGFFINESNKYWESQIFEADKFFKIKGYDTSDLSTRLTPEGSRREISFDSQMYYMESVVIMLYSMTEKELHKICEALHTYTEQDIRLDKRGYIAGSKKYIEETSELDWGEFDPEWLFIKDLGKIRNSYVHHHDEDKLEQTRNILKERTGQDELSTQFIVDARAQIGSFFEKLKSEIWLPIYKETQNQKHI